MRDNYKLLGVMSPLVLAIALSGCGTPARHHGVPSVEIENIRAVDIYHTVMGGETLWSIARHYRIDADTLARINSLSSSSRLEKGQVLVIPKTAHRRNITPARRTFSSHDSFNWPVRGSVISYFGTKLDNTMNKGIDIRVNDGDDVIASRAGTVVYCDDRLKGFGKTIIIDHGDSFQTVYAYNSQILVNVGDSIRQNEVIAKAGRTGRAKEPSVHFEIRKGGEPCNPMNYLSR
jgi:murein DD-endopeptidase MepM/ murein hydrolase activator NlpD